MRKDEDSGVVEVACPTCHEMVEPNEDNECPYDGTDLSDLIPDDEESEPVDRSKLTKATITALYKATADVLRLRKDVARLRQQIADTRGLEALRVAKAELAAGVEKLAAKTQIRRPHLDPLEAATQQLKALAEERRGRGWL